MSIINITTINSLYPIATTFVKVLSKLKIRYTKIQFTLVCPRFQKIWDIERNKYIRKRGTDNHHYIYLI